MRYAWRHLIVAAASPTLAVCSIAQSNNYPSNSSGSIDKSAIYQRPDSTLSGYDPNLSHRQFVARRQEAHNRMMDNAARLLALTRELQESIRLHEPTAGDARSLDDIAKLARAVRDQMRQ